MTKNPISISYKFTDLSTKDQELVKEIVKKNIDIKMDSYFKKVLSKDDAEIRIEYTIKYHDDTKKYDGTFIFVYDGKDFVYSQEGFKILEDLVNHAFQHLKEKMSDK